ncbi:hypothetical protein AB0L63_20395 [Nocardia sp. NPDC051990]|uniref:hypothetical protein n=1 Tax=Nocardia sp. NPDC051990 TaxID=3155285 RepID=UPI00341CB2A9
MRPTTDSTTRLRGASVGAAAGAVSIAAHAAGGGAVAPGSSAVMLLVAACTVIGIVTAHARTGLVRLMILLAAGQIIGHAALSLSPHCHNAVLTGPMLLAHVVAVVVGAFLIRGAETTLRRAISRVWRAVTAVGAHLGATGPLIGTGRNHTVAAPRRLVLASGTGRRGPPARANVLIFPHPVQV